MDKKDQSAPASTSSSTIIEPRVIFVTGDIDSEMHEHVAKQLLTFESASQFPIHIHINSYGGDAYEMLGIIDLLQSSSCDIITTCTGKAMSAAVPILASGVPGFRRIGRNSTIMLHEVSGFSWGKIYEMETSQKECIRIQEIYLKLLAKFTKTPISKFKKMFDSHKDTFLTAQEAVKIGIADGIF